MAKTSVFPRSLGKLLWHPFEIDPVEQIWGPTIPDVDRGVDRTFVLNMNFGGPSGEKLSHINRVAALYDIESQAFRGFAFYYNDNKQELFGFQNKSPERSALSECIEQSFVLDGPGGERITSVNSTEVLHFVQVSVLSRLMFSRRYARMQAIRVIEYPCNLCISCR